MGFSKKGERQEEKLSLQTSQWQAVNYDWNPRRPRVMHVCGFVNKVMFDRIGGGERTSQGWCNIFRNATKLLHVLGIIGHRLAWPDAPMLPQTNKDFWGAFEMKIHAAKNTTSPQLHKHYQALWQAQSLRGNGPWVEMKSAAKYLSSREPRLCCCLDPQDNRQPLSWPFLQRTAPQIAPLASILLPMEREKQSLRNQWWSSMAT